MQDEQLLTTLEASVRLHLPAATLAYWRQTHQGPPWFKLGPRKVMYRATDVNGWLEEQYQNSGDHTLSAVGA